MFTAVALAGLAFVVSSAAHEIRAPALPVQQVHEMPPARVAPALTEEPASLPDYRFYAHSHAHVFLCLM